MGPISIAIYLEARYQSWKRASGHYNAIYSRRSFLMYHPELTNPSARAVYDGQRPDA